MDGYTPAQAAAITGLPLAAVHKAIDSRLIRPRSARSGATVRDVIERVRGMGDSSRLPDAPMVAVNEQYASRDRELRHGDEVALIPPVAGG